MLGLLVATVLHPIPSQLLRIQKKKKAKKERKETELTPLAFFLFSHIFFCTLYTYFLWLATRESEPPNRGTMRGRISSSVLLLF